jgi:hypothetical protein
LNRLQGSSYPDQKAGRRHGFHRYALTLVSDSIGRNDGV